MKSGSLRAMPGPPKRHRGLRNVEIDHDAAAEPLRRDARDRQQLGLGRQRAEGVVDEPAGGRGIDVADHRDLERIAREHALDVAAKIVGGDVRHRLERAVHLARIGMAREGRVPPGAAGDIVRRRGRALQPRHDLRADALDGARLEVRAPSARAAAD